VLDLSRQQEVTKQQESKEKEADYRRQAAQLEKERETVRYQEERHLEEQRAQVAARMKQYEDELARKRMMAEHELQRQRNSETVKLNEEAHARQEGERLKIERQIQAERRSAESYAAELKKQVEREKALAEAEGRIKENRENEDVNRRAAILRYQEETKKAIESINAIFGNLGNASLELLADRTKLLTLVGGVTGLFLGIFGAREATRVVGRTIDRWLGTPRLVRETSRFNIWDVKTWGQSSQRAKSFDEVKRDFSDIVLPAQLHNNVRLLASSAANTKKHGAPFRHMLFYGPPGTGKTMAAKRLARTSGMDYAIMSGGDVAPLAGKAVTQLHEVRETLLTLSLGV
jgi:ATPase family AAA domain-containing protein 3A/B